jgi:hypothetical protein
MPLAPFRARSLDRVSPSTEFTDWEKERLVGTTDIVEETKDAFRRGEWFGAFARLHCVIEFWMQEIYEFDCGKDQEVGQADYLNKHYFYGYWRLVEDVRKIGIITDEEATRLVEFGILRNRIFHRLIRHSYSTGPNDAVGKDEVARGFEEGLALETLLKERLRKLTSNYQR